MMYGKPAEASLTPRIPGGPRQPVPAGNPSVRSLITESWRRCTRRGLDPLTQQLVYVTDEELERRCRSAAEFLTAARPLMEDLYWAIKGSGFVISLSDSEGCTLELTGDEDALGNSREGGLRPGALLSEAEAGTTAIGLALVTGAAHQVCGAEHFSLTLKEWTCSAAPVKDPDGPVVGVIALSGRVSQAHTHTLGMVIAAASSVEARLIQAALDRQMIARRRLAELALSAVEHGVITLDDEGRIYYMNGVAARLLQVDPAMWWKRPIAALLPVGPEFLAATSKQTECVERAPRLGLEFLARPVSDDEGHWLGSVVGVVPVTTSKEVGDPVTYSFRDIVGSSPAIVQAINRARTAARSNSPVLLLGESGTGKEIFAQAIHNASSRTGGPFVAINCAALPRDLLASELFGYVEGAFTGASKKGNPGKFEQADGGTIFLDEIGEMPADMQAVLLRVLQDKKVTRVGGQRSVAVDVRIIAATNRNLTLEVANSHFRTDLFYRLNVLPIQLPALRERSQDIPVLVSYFIKETADTLRISPPLVRPAAMEILKAYYWPGNIRELRNVIDQILHFVTDPILEVEDLPDHIKSGGRQSTGNVVNFRAAKSGFVPITTELSGQPRVSDEYFEGAGRPGLAGKQGGLREQEQQAIRAALESCAGNVTRAAKMLGIGRTTLYRKIRGYRI